MILGNLLLGEILENLNFWNLYNKIIENMVGIIIFSKYKYMLDVNFFEKKFWIYVWYNVMLIEFEYCLCCNVINV